MPDPGAGRLDGVMVALYDLSQTIGGEMSVEPLLARALQRFLYHASFPAGFICLDPVPGPGPAQTTIVAAVGDYRLSGAVGAGAASPRALFAPAGLQEGQGGLLDALPGRKGRYTCFLRLRIPGYGSMFMMGSRPHGDDLPWERIFEPALAHLGRALTLCAANDAHRLSLTAERDELAGKQRLSARMLDSIGSGIFVTDAAGAIVSANAAFEGMTGRGQQAILGRRPRQFVSARGAAPGEDPLEGGPEGDSWVGEVDVADKDGRTLPAMMVLSAVRDAGGAVTNRMGIVTDISEKKGAEDRIDFLAHHDQLTKLPNLGHFREMAEYSIAKSRWRTRLFLLSLNVDNFNAVNSSLGHSAGDAVLVQLSQRLVDCLGEQDMVCRVGGNHFLALLHDIADREGVLPVAKRLLADLSRPIAAGAVQVSLTSTVGAAACPDDGADFDTLFKCADTAMKYAKASERGFIRFFDDSTDKTLSERFSLENQLRFAVERGELELHYQPFIDFQDMRVRGVECLLRWNSPALGRVAPSVFIPVAEQSGLIVPIGEWVLREACEQCARWRADGVPIETVAVNLSAVQFRRSDLPALVEKHLTRCGLEPSSLELELTESIMISDTDRALKTVASLKRIGVALSLDDFGTGYSSFSYLSRFPLDKLKIDQSFVQDMTVHPESEKIVRTIVELGKNLGLVTIAEGIETTRQFGMLRSAGCDLAQGYLFARPMPAADLTRMVLPGGGLADGAGPAAADQA